MPCECLSQMAGIGPESFGDHHHKNCEHYATEKYSYLYYYDEGSESWLPADPYLETYVFEDCELGEVVEVQLKQVELTDKEVDELPED